jgi:hypothetical protein
MEKEWFLERNIEAEEKCKGSELRYFFEESKSPDGEIWVEEAAVAPTTK